MIETKSEIIGGRNWSVTQFSGTKNLDILHSLLGILGPALARAVSTRDLSAVLEAEVNLGAVVDSLIRNMGSSDQLRGLVFKILANTHCDEKPMSPAVFDDVFAGTDIMHLPAVLGFVLVVNFGDFTKAAEAITSLSAARVSGSSKGEVSASSRKN